MLVKAVKLLSAVDGRNPLQRDDQGYLHKLAQQPPWTFCAMHVDHVRPILLDHLNATAELTLLGLAPTAKTQPTPEYCAPSVEPHIEVRGVADLNWRMLLRRIRSKTEGEARNFTKLLFQSIQPPPPDAETPPKTLTQPG